MKTILELKQDLGKLWDEARKIDELADTEKRDLTPDEEKRSNELIAKMDALQVTIERREKLEGFTGVSGLQGEQRGGNGIPSYHQRPTKDTPEAIMCRYIRSGGRDFGAANEMHQASLDQYRNGDNIQDKELQAAFREERASNDTSMNITTAGDGGNLVPVGHYNRIIARKDESGLAASLPIMPIPGVGTTVNVPTDAEADGEFVSTSEQADDHSNSFDRDAPAVGKVQMTLVKYTKKIELTDELLQDNDSNLMNWLDYRVGLGLRKTDNNLIVTEALANGTAALTLDGTAAITTAEVPELVYLQADGYEDNSQWVMRKQTLGHLMGKTGDNFQLASTPGGSRNGELWTYPVQTTGKMPAIGAGNKSLLFGDFSFMGVRRMPGLTMLVDPYTVDGMLVLKYYYRVVFKVLQSAAIIYATHPTA